MRIYFDYFGTVSVISTRFCSQCEARGAAVLNCAILYKQSTGIFLLSNYKNNVTFKITSSELYNVRIQYSDLKTTL